MSSLAVMEHFYTVQGEGAFSGHAAYFIRLGGCDVGCHWCDVKDSWPIDAHPKMSCDDLVNLVKVAPGSIVVITGGEPWMHKLQDLTSALKNIGKRTHVETSGAHPASGHWDWVCLSPKKFKPVLTQNYSLANELKVIINHPSDFEFAEQEASKVAPSCKLYLQPEWSKQDRFNQEIVQYVMNNPRWSISLQTHKFLNIP